MKLKKPLRILLILILLAILAIGGLSAVKKAYSMYKNLFAESEKLQNVLTALGTRMDKLEKTVGTHVQRYEFDYGWLDEISPLVAHGCGEINGQTYTNSLEAFKANYDLGYRVFEVDFDITNDNVLVATHSENTWRKQTGADENTLFSIENYNRLPLYDQYQSLNAEEIIDLLEAYPDAYLITDTKYTNRVNVMLQFAQLVRCAERKNASVLDRIVPQIYCEEMLDWVMSVYPFRSVVFTLYKTEWTPESVLRFCDATGVGFITTWYVYLTQELADLWRSHDLHIGVHTINNIPVASDCLSMGAALIYSDKLQPADFVR